MEKIQTKTYKAKRCKIHIGDILLAVFQLPDGSYRLSLSEVAGVADKQARSIFEFLRSKYLKALLADESNLSISGKVAVEGSQGLITPIPIETALLYWNKWAQRGNAKALALVIALARRSLHDLADETFGEKRSQRERDLTLEEDISPQGVDRLQSMSQQLELAQTTIAETQTERELKLKIQLAELELEKEQLRHSRNSNCLCAKDMTKVGAVSWLATQWVQQTLGLETEEQAYEQMCRWGYSLESGR